MNRNEKAELIETLQSTLSEAAAIVVTHQTGLTVAESSDLRGRMREAGAGFKVTKNRLTKIALQGTKYEDISDLFTGPTAMGTSADPVAAAKVLVNFAKENDKLTVIGGSLDGKVLDKAGVESSGEIAIAGRIAGKACWSVERTSHTSSTGHTGTGCKTGTRDTSTGRSIAVGILPY